jgi:PAS domain S-box-containing protein
MLQYEEAIAEIVQEPLAVLDATLRIERANAAFCRVFGCTREDAQGRPIEQVVQGHADYRVLEPLLGLAVGPTRTGSLEIRPAAGGTANVVVSVRRLAAAADGAETVLLGFSAF